MNCDICLFIPHGESMATKLFRRSKSHPTESHHQTFSTVRAQNLQFAELIFLRFADGAQLPVCRFSLLSTLGYEGSPQAAGVSSPESTRNGAGFSPRSTSGPQLERVWLNVWLNNHNRPIRFPRRPLLPGVLSSPRAPSPAACPRGDLPHRLQPRVHLRQAPDGQQAHAPPLPLLPGQPIGDTTRKPSWGKLLGNTYL